MSYIGCAFTGQVLGNWFHACIKVPFLFSARKCFSLLLILPNSPRGPECRGEGPQQTPQCQRQLGRGRRGGGGGEEQPAAHRGALPE